MKSALIASALIVSSFTRSHAQSLSWMHYDHGNSPLPSNSVSAILSDEDGTWVGTDAGLSFFNGSDWTVYTSETSELPDNNIRDIHKDNWGNTWVATDGGVLKMNENGWEVLTVDNSGIPSDLVRSISTDSEGNLWVGTWGEGIASLIGDQWTTYNTFNSGLPSNGVFTVELDYLGQVWIGTYNGGVTVFDGHSWSTNTTANSALPQNHVRCIVFDHNASVWLGTDDGIANINSEGVWDVYNYQNIGYSFHVVNDGLEDDNGNVHFATDGGILSFDQEGFNMITAQNSDLPSNYIRCLSDDSNENIWLGTGNDGVAIYSHQSSLGTNDISNNDGLISIYPNPTANEINVQLADPLNETARITIVNSLGQTVKTQNLTVGSAQKNMMDLNDLTTGFYQLTVRSSSMLSTRSFYKL